MGRFFIKTNGLMRTISNSILSLPIPSNIVIIRERQIERAKKFVKSPSKLTRNKSNDPKRFIEQGHCTPDGEVASKTIISLNQEHTGIFRLPAALKGIGKEKQYAEKLF